MCIRDSLSADRRKAHLHSRQTVETEEDAEAKRHRAIRLRMTRAERAAADVDPQVASAESGCGKADVDGTTSVGSDCGQLPSEPPVVPSGSSYEECPPTPPLPEPKAVPSGSGREEVADEEAAPPILDPANVVYPPDNELPALPRPVEVGRREMTGLKKPR